MKTFFAALTLCLAAHCALAQPFQATRFELSHTNGNNYSALSANASIFDLPVDWDDDISNTVPLPFPFSYQGVLVTSIAAETYGTLILNSKKNSYIECGHIFGVFMDYESKNRGKVLYETTGTSPERIFKVEFNNVGRYADTIGNDTMNFQIWLREADNSIEYHIGYHNVPDNQIATTSQEFFAQQKDVVFVGLLTNTGDELKTELNTTYIQYFSNDPPIKDSIAYFPDLIASVGPDVYVESSYKKYPDNGDIFRFVPKDVPNSIISISMFDGSISPNPSTSGAFNISLAGDEKPRICSVYDISGRKMKTITIRKQHSTLDISTLPKGIYTLVIETNGRRQVSRLVYR